MDQLLAKLRSRGLLDDDRVAQARAALAEGRPLDDVLVAQGGMTELDMLGQLGEAFHLPLVDLEIQKPTREFVARFPARVLLRHNLLPVSEENGVVSVAIGRPLDRGGLDVLRLATGRDFRPVLAPREEIARRLKEILGVGADTVQSLVSDADASGIQVINHDEDGESDLAAAAGDASIIRFVNQVLTEAIDLRATDVHFEPFEDRFRVRYRVDGVLVEASTPAEVRRFQAAIVSRIKILSHLDIAEKRLPQDGRIKLKIGLREVDVRVSIIPMLHGEAVVLRLLDRGAPLLGLEKLGMAGRDRGIFERVLDLPHGIVMVTGPTGSGKTTTLYAGLSRINDIERKIITIEDPIEYHLDGINQIQVATKAGLTFASGLRSILRHDPDVVLIGEIRDHETAEIAVQASLTGHLVFSTLHTNDAPGAVARLVEMGVEPYLVASSLELVLAQRLVRLVCKACAKQVTPGELEAQELLAEYGERAPVKVWRGAGCRECRGTGFRGRSGIFEVMEVDEEIRSMVLSNSPAIAMRRVANRNGMTSLREDGKRLVLEGRTTLEEVLRMTRDESTALKPEGKA
ncbi:MAG: GspE/PulE family protein [Planctomycetota bacterium]|nr:GspE/PulE family protein [Planctomycetota bacterium]